MEQLYIIVGDNNYWYRTFTAATLEEAEKVLEEEKENVRNGNTSDQDMEEADTLYLYKAQEVGRVSTSYLWDPAVCTSSLGDDDKPMTKGETAHRWDEDTDPQECAECGSIRDEDTDPKRI